MNRSGWPLTTDGLGNVLDTLAKKAGLNPHDCGPHRWRHSFAKRLLLSGQADVYRVARLMGHSSVQVTVDYLRDVTAQEARQGISLLDSMTTQGTKG